MASRIRRIACRRLWGRPGPSDAPVVESVADWATRTGLGEVLLTRLGPTVEKIPPNTLEPEIHHRFGHNAVFTVETATVVRIAGVVLEVPRGRPWPPPHDSADHLDRPRLVLPDGTVAAESTQRYVNRARPQPARRLRPQPGRWCSLLALWGLTDNAFHWTFDVLARIEPVLPVIPDDVRFIVRPGLAPYQRESLALIGIGPERLVEFDPPGGRIRGWRLEECWFVHLGYRLDPTDLRGFGERMRARIDPLDRPAGSGPRRIYLSRRDASYRRVVNEAEVEAVLQEYGFETCVLTGMSYADQVARFRNAEVIVGPHGAGFAGTVYAPPGTTIVEIHSSQVDQCFHNLCQALGNPYWYLHGVDRANESSYVVDMEVDTERLRATLERALAT